MNGVLSLIKIVLGRKTDISTLIDKYIRGIFLCNRPRKKIVNKMFICFTYKVQKFKPKQILIYFYLKQLKLGMINSYNFKSVLKKSSAPPLHQKVLH